MRLHCEMPWLEKTHTCQCDHEAAVSFDALCLGAIAPTQRNSARALDRWSNRSEALSLGKLAIGKLRVGSLKVESVEKCATPNNVLAHVCQEVWFIT